MRFYWAQFYYNVVLVSSWRLLMLLDMHFAYSFQPFKMSSTILKSFPYFMLKVLSLQMNCHTYCWSKVYYSLIQICYLISLLFQGTTSTQTQFSPFLVCDRDLVVKAISVNSHPFVSQPQWQCLTLQIMFLERMKESTACIGYWNNKLYKLYTQGQTNITCSFHKTVVHAKVCVSKDT